MLMPEPLAVLIESMVIKTVKEMIVEKRFRQIGEEVVEFTAEEYAQIEKENKEAADRAKAIAEAKVLAETKLEALGLSVDDLKALGLG